MAQKQLGLYWGKEDFCFVEASGSSVEKFVQVPLASPSGSFDVEELPEGLRLTNLLEKAFIDYQFSVRQINLSIPTRELIFRSFVIPAMASEDVKNVVEFEATKYMPIKLEDLFYTFYSYSFHENNLDHLRVFFVAVKKDTLDKYTGILQHTNIKINTIEPAAVSLYRLLSRQSEVPRKHTTAIIEQDKKSCRIIIVDNDVVQFIRESPLSFQPDVFQQSLTRLITDLRVSVNFFARQNTSAKLKKIVLVSLQKEKDIVKALEDDFGVSVSNVIAAKLLKRADIPHIGLLSAYGAASKGKKLFVRDFNLHADVGDALLSQTPLIYDIERIKTVVVSFVICAAIVLASFFFTGKMSRDRNQKLTAIENQLGPFSSVEKAEIVDMTSDLEEKLTDYKNVQTKSTIYTYLHKIPALMPKGMWLKSMKVGKQNSGESDAGSQEFIELIGYVYRDNINEQFKLINKFYTQLKEQDEFKEKFKNIDMKTRQEELNNYSVYSFLITFK